MPEATLMARLRKQTFTAAEVRAEIYQLHNETRKHWNEHLSDVAHGRWPVSKDLHLQSECPRCRMESRTLFVLGSVIRRFGGRVRR